MVVFKELDMKNLTRYVFDISTAFSWYGIITLHLFFLFQPVFDTTAAFASPTQKSS